MQRNARSQVGDAVFGRLEDVQLPHRLHPAQRPKLVVHDIELAQLCTLREIVEAPQIVER
jgi:hypothetical protein